MDQTQSVAGKNKNSKQHHPGGGNRNQGFSVDEGKNSAKSIRLEPLEERVLYSADVIGLNFTEWSADTSADDTQDAVTQIGASPETGIELIFIDTSVPQRQILIDDLQQQINNGRNAKIVQLESNEDGLATISHEIAAQDSVTAIHIISHGTSQGVKIGDTWLDDATAKENIELLNQWQQSLTDTADLIIYGCNLAASDEGIALLDTLAEATQTDVAASIDRTGHDNLQANWTLEHTIGQIEHDIALSAQAQEAWENELAIEFALQAKDVDLGVQPINASFDFSGGDLTIEDQLIGTIPNGTSESIQVVSVTAPASDTLIDNGDNTYTCLLYTSDAADE